VPSYLAQSELGPVDALAENGWWLGSKLFGQSVLQSLAAKAIELAESNLLTAAAVGRGVYKQQLAGIRQDKIQWIDSDCDAHREFFKVCDELQQLLNRGLYLGLNSVEAHYAHYSDGAFYQHHIDSFKGAKNRMVSMVVYLNSDWQASHEGELKLWDKAGVELGCIAPRRGDVLLMLSEEMPHQVLPTKVDRYSIAAWFRC
jgi:SM-20-related protein